MHDSRTLTCVSVSRLFASPPTLAPHTITTTTNNRSTDPHSDPVIVLSLAVVFVFSVVFLHLFTKGEKLAEDHYGRRRRRFCSSDQLQSADY